MVFFFFYYVFLFFYFIILYSFCSILNLVLFLISYDLPTTPLTDLDLFSGIISTYLFFSESNPKYVSLRLSVFLAVSVVSWLFTYGLPMVLEGCSGIVLLVYYTT